MLAVGREKLLKKGLADKIELLSGDSENLQFNFIGQAFFEKLSVYSQIKLQALISRKVCWL